MAEVIEVLKSFYASIQDLGRQGYRALGVPVGGALDKISAVYANALVGNKPEEAVIEIIGGNFSFKALKDIIVAVTGAYTNISVDGLEVSMWRPVLVKKGSIVEIGPCFKGFITYLAIAGGIDVDIIMGSKSTYLRAHFGGYNGRLLKVGDRLSSKYVDLRNIWVEVESKTVPEHVKNRIPEPKNTVTIRCTKGIHYELLKDDVEKLFNAVYVIKPDSDRMGYKLEGPPIESAKSLGRLISVVTDRGFVQIPPDGEPIILMSDAQTTGGYAVALHVLPSDVDLVAQCSPTYKVRFIEVSIEEAENNLRKYLNELKNPKLVEEEVWGEYFQLTLNSYS